MKPDIYTKAVLTVIALTLLMIAYRQSFTPAHAVGTEAQAVDAEFAGSGSGFFFLDNRTGELWSYVPTHNEYKSGDQSQVTRVHGKWESYGKITHLGQPLVGAAN